MTFRTGQKTNTPWRREALYGRAFRHCAGCGKSFSKALNECRGAHDFCSVECSVKFRKRAGA